VHARAQYLRWVFALWMLLCMQGHGTCVECLPCACSCACKAQYLRWVFALCMLLCMQGLNTCVGCLPCACSCACKGSLLTLGVCLVHALAHARTRCLRWVFALCMLLCMQGLNTCVGCLPCGCSCACKTQYLRWVFALCMLFACKGSILALGFCLVDALAHARLNTCVGCMPCACSCACKAQYLRWMFALCMLL